MFKRFMPCFEANGVGGAGGGETTEPNTGTKNATEPNAGGEGTTEPNVGNNNSTEPNAGGEGTTEPNVGNNNSTEPNTDDLDRLLKARLDKAMEEERKKNKSLEKEIEKMKRDKMTADELKKYDDEKRDRELAEREQAIADRENRYYAISAIKKAGLDDGGDTALKIVDLVLGKDSDEIDNKVSALNELVNKLVDNKVNEKFKSAGRIPNTGSANANTNTEDKKGNELAKGLGKERAELKKKSDSILKHYI